MTTTTERTPAQVKQNLDLASQAVPDQLWADLRDRGLIS